MQYVKSYSLVFSLILTIGISPLVFAAHSADRPSKDNAAERLLISDADPDSLSPKVDDDKLMALVEYFKSQGYDIQQLLNDERFEIYGEIANRFKKSAEKKSRSLDSYKRVLGFDQKASQIVSFIDAHSQQLKKAEETYGISHYVIAAILGIESDFGKNIGSYNPFNAYVSMYAKEYRQDFAKAQLKELLEFTRRKNIDVFELKSSYAGAMAFAQFIPYSLNKWFVGDDIFDMDNNIMSIGNYLAYFKERTGDIETAVMRYNPSSLYTNAVLDLAQQAERHYQQGR